MSTLLRHLRLVVLATTALALSAGLAFGATPPEGATGLANAAAHAGKTVPVVTDAETTGDEDTSVGDEEGTETETDTTDETTDTSTDEVADSEDSSDACTVDPTALTPEELAAMNHGSVVCWAAQQTEWPTWFANHGAFVRCWAHQGKADAVSCTEDPTTVDATGDSTADSTGDSTGGQAPVLHGKDQGHGHGKAYGKLKHQG